MNVSPKVQAVARFWILASVGALVMVVAPVSAATLDADLTAESARAMGNVQLDGGLVAWKMQGLEGEASDSKFSLRAESAQQRALVSDPAVNPGMGLPRIGLEATSDDAEWREAHFEGGTTRVGFDLRLFALDGHEPPRIEATVDCADLNAPAGQVTYAPYVPNGNSARSPAFDSTRTVHVTPCAGPDAITVTGDFLLTLWQWDYAITQNGQTSKGTTGWTPATGAMPDAVGSRRELFLYVQNGALHLPAIGFEAWLAESRLAVDGTLAAERATGLMQLESGDTRLDREPVALAGHIEAASRRVSGVLTHDVSGQAEEVRVASRTIGLQPPSVPVVAVWGSIAGALLAVGVLTHLWIGRSGRQLAAQWVSGPISRRKARAAFWAVWADRLLDGRRLVLARIAVRRANALAPGSEEALVVHARLSWETGQYESQLHSHDALRRILSNPGERAFNSVQAARACVRLQRNGDAIKNLIEAAASSPELVARTLDDEDFASLRNHAWVRMRHADAAMGNAAYT